MYFDYGLDVPLEDRFQVIATGDALVTENDSVDDKPQPTEYASDLADAAMEAAAVKLGAKKIDDVIRAQMERCESGFCPDLKEKLDSGHHCVIMTGKSKAARNDSVKYITKDSLVWSSDPETPYLVSLGYIDSEEV